MADEDYMKLTVLRGGEVQQQLRVPRSILSNPHVTAFAVDVETGSLTVYQNSGGSLKLGEQVVPNETLTVLMS